MKHVTFLSATASSATTLAQGSTSDASSTDSSCSRYDAVSKVSLTVHSDQKVEASDRVQEHIQDRSKVQITGRKRLNSTSKSTSDSSALSKCTDSDEGSGKRRKIDSECFKDDLQTGGEMISRLNSRESSTTLQFKFDTSGFVSGANESSMPTINSASSQSSMLQLSKSFSETG